MRSIVYKCPVCGLQFEDSPSCAEHKREHFVCKGCSKRFVSEKFLNNHIRKCMGDVFQGWRIPRGYKAENVAEIACTSVAYAFSGRLLMPSERQHIQKVFRLGEHGSIVVHFKHGRMECKTAGGDVHDTHLYLFIHPEKGAVRRCFGKGCILSTSESWTRIPPAYLNFIFLPEEESRRAWEEHKEKNKRL